MLTWSWTRFSACPSPGGADSERTGGAAMGARITFDCQILLSLADETCAGELVRQPAGGGTAMQFAGAADAILEGTVARAPRGPDRSTTGAESGTRPEWIGLPRPMGRCPESTPWALRPALVCEDRICQEI